MTTGVKSRRFRAALGDAAFDVEVGPTNARVRGDSNDAPVEFVVGPLDAGSIRVEPVEATAGGGSTHASVTTSGDTTWVFIDGEVWTIDVEPAERVRRARAGSGSDGLSAPMPATVIRILTEPGRDVRRGDTLLLLEAMKMELPVRAPRDGRIAAVRCQAGELVQPGVALVDFE